mgnify:CR=1 FL=1
MTPVSLKVTVCGSSGGYPAAGRACSGYLLESGGGSLMLDIGAAALPNMLRYIDADRLDGLALTHMHYDHYSDIYGLCTARRFWESELPPVRLLAPGGAWGTIASPLSESSREAFSRCLDISTPREGEPVELEGFDVAAAPASHVVEALSFKVSAEGRSVCYSGDTEVCDALLELARGVDLLICEATFTSEVAQKAPGHMYASEAGRVAREAGVGALLLTHLWPTLDAERALEEAASEFAGPVDVAVEGLTQYVGPFPCPV